MTTRRVATGARIRAAALDLFEAHGYRAVTVEQIAGAAGVSHMTFFRHFATKEGVLLEDPFDPMIAAAVAAQPAKLAPIDRLVRGLRSITALIDVELDAETRRAIAVIAGVPELQAASMANTMATEQAIVDQAATPGHEVEMRVAAAACLAAISATLLASAGTEPPPTIAQLVDRAVATIRPEPGRDDGGDR